MVKEKVFICNCHSPEHQIIVSYFKEDPKDPFIYVQPRLNHFHPLWKRILFAFGYVFKSHEARYDEVILNKEKMIELRDLIDKKLDELN